MVSLIERSRFEPWLGHCFVFLDKTVYSLSTQEYTCMWVPVNCQGNLTKCWGVSCDGLASHPGGVAIFLVATLLPFSFYYYSTVL